MDTIGAAEILISLKRQIIRQTVKYNSNTDYRFNMSNVHPDELNDMLEIIKAIKESFGDVDDKIIIKPETLQVSPLRPSLPF
jgi:hypothetical protein